MEIDVSRLLRDALHHDDAEINVDARLAEACRRAYPACEADALRNARAMLDRAAERMECSPLEAARRLAQGKAVARTSSRVVHSLDELPPELRARAERMIAAGESSSTKTVQTSYSAGRQGAAPSGGRAFGFPGDPPMHGRNSSRWLWPVRVAIPLVALAAAAWAVSLILR